MASCNMPSELASIIAVHRKLFGGFTMVEDDQEPPPESDQLGEGGTKALAAERVARKAAEKAASDAAVELQSLRDALTAANADVEKSQQEAAKATAETTKLRIASRHGISDEDAAEFLTGADEESLTRQAARLKELSKVPDLPPFDPTQGPHGSDNKPNALPGAPRMAQAFDEALNSH